MRGPKIYLLSLPKILADSLEPLRHIFSIQTSLSIDLSSSLLPKGLHLPSYCQASDKHTPGEILATSLAQLLSLGPSVATFRDSYFRLHIPPRLHPTQIELIYSTLYHKSLYNGPFSPMSSS